MRFYIHIPFCVRKCDYCAFYSLGGANENIKEEYTKALIKQIGAFSRCRSESIYIGGGTPTSLGRELLLSIIDALKARFELAPGCEFTVEVNPGTVDADYLKALHDAGVNRLSLGVQSLSDDELRRIGRIHTAAQAIKTFEDAHKAGFENISADMIFALPFQTVADVERTARGLLGCGITHLSAYSLQLEEGTKLWQRREGLAFPDEDTEQEMYDAICRITRERGFIHYEVSSYGRPGFFSQHNSAYWTREEYMGFGAAAHSFIGGRRFSAPSDIDEYILRVTHDDAFSCTDFASSAILTEDEAREEEIMLSLRTSRGVRLGLIDRTKAASLEKIGLGDIKNGRFCLNDRGFRLSNAIIAELI